MKSASRCKINGLHVAEVTIKNLPSTPITMDAKYALGRLEKLPTGQDVLQETHGQCSAYTNNWSESTMKLLRALIDSMEQDLLPRHFEETAGMESDDEWSEFGAVEEAPQV
jgi:hypothetical protein